MEAGEAVYQGREGTGLAQILHWQDYQAPRTQIDPYKAKQFELAQRKLRDDQIAKYRDFDIGGDSHFKPKLQADKNAYDNAFNDLTYHQGIDPIVAYRMLQPQQQELKRKAMVSERARQDYKDISAANKENKYADDEWFQQRATDVMFPLDADPDKVNFEAANNLLSHARNFKTEAFLADAIEPFKKAINTGQVDQDLFNTPLGQFFHKIDNSARFAYKNEKGELVPGVGEDLVTQVLNMNDNISDRVRWDIAKHELAAKDPSLNERLDNDAIEQRFNEIRNDPKYAPQVRKVVRDYLETANQSLQRDSFSGAGKYPTGAGKPPVPKLEVSDAIVTRSVDDADQIQDDLVGVKGKTIDLQRLPAFKKPITFGDKRGVPIRLEHDPKTGEKVIILSQKDDFGKNEVNVAVPFDDDVRTKVTSLLNKNDAKTVNDWTREGAEKIKIDNAKIETMAGRVKEIVKSGTDVPNRISDLMNKNGVTPESVTLNKHLFGPNGIVVDGTEFLMNDEGINNLKKYITNKAISSDQTFEKFRKGAESQSGGPKKGTIEGGYEFLGGDPADPKNWKKSN